MTDATVLIDRAAALLDRLEASLPEAVEPPGSSRATTLVGNET
jgi:hypothetical protein